MVWLDYYLNKNTWRYYVEKLWNDDNISNLQQGDTCYYMYRKLGGSWCLRTIRQKREWKTWLPVFENFAQIDLSHPIVEYLRVFLRILLISFQCEAITVDSLLSEVLRTEMNSDTEKLG